MAVVNLVVFAGQSLIVDNPGSTFFGHVPDRQFVQKMAGGSRTLSPFGHGASSSNGNWNVYAGAGVTTNSPVVKFADEWEARTNGGYMDIGDLVAIVCGRGGASFAVEYGIDDSSQWNLLRHRNLSSTWDGTFYSTPSDQGGGVYPTGPSYSCVDTLTQALASAVSIIEGAGDQVRFLFGCWAHGQADSFTMAAANAYQANEQGLMQVVADTLGIDIAELPWHTVLLSGEPLTRTGGPTVNAAKRALAAQYPNVSVIDPTAFPGYDPGDADTYGGYHTDGTHLSDLAAWRISDANWSLSVDAGNLGVTL